MEDSAKKLIRIDKAFSKLNNYENVFRECERTYNAVYKNSKRTYAIKSSELQRSKLYVPLIKTTCNIIHSVFKTSFLSSGCPIEIKRIGMRTENDLILQNALNVAVKNIWQNSTHRVGLSKAVLSAIYLPMGIVSLFYDNNEIKTRFIPINDIAFDPDASDINDIEYVCYKWKQSKRDVIAKFKSKFYKNENQDLIINGNEERIEIKEIYEKQDGFYKLTTFIESNVVRQANFETLPFHFGYCLDSMTPIDKSERNNYLGVYGSCLPIIVKELQEEYNIKRNQKIDITEQIIDPQFAISNENGSISMNDLVSRKKYVRVETSLGANVRDMIIPLNPNTTTYPITEEIEMLKSEYEIATGVNSVMTGQTNPSDRRAMGALQAVNSSSSMRIESMLQTLVDTMLNSYAKSFVKLVYRNTSDEDFIYLTEDEQIIDKIGTQSFRMQNDIKFDIKTNFGTTISNETTMNKLNAFLGVLAQNGLNMPNVLMPLIKEMMILMMGDNAPIEQIEMAYEQMMNMQEQQQQEQQEQQESPQDGEKNEILDGGI